MSSAIKTVPTSRKIVIIGGVAGGASAAARARRANAEAEIILLEKGPTVSFANCGLPYHVGGEIKERKSLLVATPELFWNRFRIQVKTQQEAIRIDRASKQVEVLDHATGERSTIAYDRLILSTGAEPIRPAAWPENANNIFQLWTLTDMDRVIAYLQSNKVKRVAVIGGGFVGLEAVEQFRHLGLEVVLIERNPQVLGPLDIDMARMVEKELTDKGVELQLSKTIQSFPVADGAIHEIKFEDGTSVPCQLVLAGTGVRPRTELAVAAGLAIGKSGGVSVNAHMQTSDPSIYAVGDMVEYEHGVLLKPLRVPLAGPANRAGRIAGEHAATDQSEPMGPVFGTAIVRVFGVTAACTGLSEKACKASQIDYRAVIIQAANHASYFPGAQNITLKLIYQPGDGKILGAQAVGGEGVDKRIDIVATAMRFNATVHQLATLDLAYAPPFGSAKDPIHMAAFAACNDLAQWPSIVAPDQDLDGYQVIDVRTATERQNLPLANAIPIPVDEIAEQWKTLDPNRPTIVVCHSGKRAHVAACYLRGKGFQNVRNLTGGMSVRRFLKA